MNQILENAFPSDLISSLRLISDRLVSPSIFDPSDPFSVVIAGGQIEIPYRIYVEPLTDHEVDQLPQELRIITACWFSRHHDGRVRERFLRSISANDSDWIVSYVLPLCGEYVLPILDLIWDERDRFSIHVLTSWIRLNTALYQTIRRRIVSYWNCYYRSENPDFSKYVGGRLIEFMDDHLHPDCGAISK
jgi:hypothetical protein